jgi:hypothetical protein
LSSSKHLPSTHRSSLNKLTKSEAHHSNDNDDEDEEGDDFDMDSINLIAESKHKIGSPRKGSVIKPSGSDIFDDEEDDDMLTNIRLIAESRISRERCVSPNKSDRYIQNTSNYD